MHGEISTLVLALVFMLASKPFARLNKPSCACACVNACVKARLQGQKGTLMLAHVFMLAFTR